MRVVLTPEDVAAEEEAVDYASKNWGWTLFSSIVLLLIGFVVISADLDAIFGLALFIGIVFIFQGVAEIVGGLRAASWRWLYIAVGVISVIAGVAALVWPVATLLVLSIFIGWVLLFWGVADLVSLFMGRAGKYWWLYLIRGILSIVLAAWALAHPAATLFVLMTLIGLWAILFGVLGIFASFTMKNAKKAWEAEKKHLDIEMA